MNTTQRTFSAVLDVIAIRDLAARSDPLASVYLGPRADPGDDTAEELVLRSRAVAAELDRQGADGPTVEAVRDHLHRLVPGSGYALFAADGEILQARAMSGVVPVDRVRYGVPAVVTPVLAWLQHCPAHVVVAMDRVGAEITQVPSGATVGRTWTVVGPDDEIERNAPGGLSQPRYHRRAEDSWRHNAAAVADEALRALHDVAGDLLFVAGDVRAVQLFGERVEDSGVVVRHLPGGRAGDGSERARRAALAAAISDHVAEESTLVLRRLVDAFGPQALAVEGAAATLAALAAGRVGTLVVTESAHGLAWFGPHTLCSDLRPADGPAQHGQLVDVAVRAALLTDAAVQVLPGDGGHEAPAEGIGALCRYSL